MAMTYKPLIANAVHFLKIFETKLFSIPLSILHFQTKRNQNQITHFTSLYLSIYIYIYLYLYTTKETGCKLRGNVVRPGHNLNGALHVNSK